MALFCYEISHLLINYLHFNFSFQFFQLALIAGFATGKKKTEIKVIYRANLPLINSNLFRPLCLSATQAKKLLLFPWLNKRALKLIRVSATINSKHHGLNVHKWIL